MMSKFKHVHVHVEDTVTKDDLAGMEQSLAKMRETAKEQNRRGHVDEVLMKQITQLQDKIAYEKSKTKDTSGALEMAKSTIARINSKSIHIPTGDNIYEAEACLKDLYFIQGQLNILESQLRRLG